jgi:hypothetical protein
MQTPDPMNCLQGVVGEATGNNFEHKEHSMSILRNWQSHRQRLTRNFLYHN